MGDLPGFTCSSLHIGSLSANFIMQGDETATPILKDDCSGGVLGFELQSALRALDWHRKGH